MQQLESIYFIGAGGIGMSALVRYYLAQGIPVGGYDRTETELTRRLTEEGAQIHYTDDPASIPAAFRNPAHTLVVYTPAIPADHQEMAWFRSQGFEIQKRAYVLGLLTRSMKGLCVAGTHGKTTTTSMLAHLLHQSHVGCNAFLGGITKNYGTVEAYKESFAHYTSLVQQGGALIVARGVEIDERLQAGVRRYDYGRHEGDFHAENLRIGGGRITFDLVSPLGNIEGVELGVPVCINIDNGIAAMALAQVAGATADEIREAMATFAGVDRRFDFQIKTDSLVFLSDYAHHPEEIRQSILSLREVFDGRKITAIFQPHLYTRTRDFYREFAEALSLLDEVILTEIYPARELPIEGVSSQLIYDALRPDMEKQLCLKKDVQAILRQGHYDVLVVLGAGDLDNQVPAIKKLLLEQQ